MNTKKKPPWKGSMGVNREVIEERTKTNCGACPETSEHQKKPPWKGSMGVNRKVIEERTKTNVVLVQRLSEHQKKAPWKGLENSKELRVNQPYRIGQ